MELLFCCQREVGNNLNGHPVEKSVQIKDLTTPDPPHPHVLDELPREIRPEIAAPRAFELSPEVLLLLVLEHGVLGVPPEPLLAPGALPVLGQVRHAVTVVILGANSIH